MIDTKGDTAFTHHALDALTARSKATINNIANQNVEGYKRYQVRFEQLLHEAVDKGEGPASVQHVVERDESGPPGANNVVLMEELALLGKTQLLHDYMLRRASGYFSTLNKAILGRS